MTQYTKETPVTGMVSVWALPNRYDLDPNAEPFTYVLRTDKPWQSGAVEVNEYEVTLVVPGGLNLIAKAIKTIEAAKAEATDDYMEKLRSLDKRIEELKQLSYQPSEPVGSGSDETLAGGLLENEEGQG